MRRRRPPPQQQHNEREKASAVSLTAHNESRERKRRLKEKSGHLYHTSNHKKSVRKGDCPFTYVRVGRWVGRFGKESDVLCSHSSSKRRKKRKQVGRWVVY